MLHRVRSFARVALPVLLAVATQACAGEPSRDDIERMAGAAQGVAFLVDQFERDNPAEARKFDDEELVRRATANDPARLTPFGKHVVRGRAGAVLVCTRDRAKALVEDHACSPKPDWINRDLAPRPCDFATPRPVSCP